MKRAILVGLAAFTLGSISSPRAANNNETLELLCTRFDSEAGAQLKLAKERIAEASKMGGGIRPADQAEFATLAAVRRIVCIR